MPCSRSSFVQSTQPCSRCIPRILRTTYGSCSRRYCSIKLQQHRRSIVSAKHSETEPFEDTDDYQDAEAGGEIWDFIRDTGVMVNGNLVRTRLLIEDPGLNQSLISSGTTVSQLFTQDKWENHRRVERYFTTLWNMPHSTVLRRILMPVLCVMGVAVCVCAWNTWRAPIIAMSVLPHTILGSALSLLLVFRTNASHARFQDGRAHWGQCVRLCRDWARMVQTYLPEKHRADAHAWIQVFPHALKSHLRSGRTRKDPNDPTSFRDNIEPAVRQLLSSNDCSLLLRQVNKPLYVLCRLTDILAAGCASGEVPGSVELQLQSVLYELNGVTGSCERILSTPIPLSYTRHTSRSLMLFLLSLPVALWSVMSYSMLPAVLVLAFVMLGIDEIGVEIEEPFCLLPLKPLCDVIERDVRAVASNFGQQVKQTEPARLNGVTVMAASA